MNDIIHHLGPIGTFLAGASAFLLGVVWPSFQYLRKIKKECVEATTAHMQALIARNLMDQAARHDPDDFFTLQVAFDSGLTLAVPMFPFTEVLVSENIRMAVLCHDRETTTVQLRCVGFGHLPRHSHADTCETVEIRSGVVTHLETGRQYRAGEVWVVPPGEMHSATFHDAVVLLTYKPPLPTAARQPVDLQNMRRIFPTS